MIRQPSNPDEILAAVQSAFPEDQVQVVDQSHQHKGHQNRDSGHYDVIITGVGFKQTPLIKRHQKVYEAVDMHRNPHIHALKIIFKAVQE